MTIMSIELRASIDIVFIINEKESMYHTAVSAFKELVIDNVFIEVFFTDNEPAL